ncbi:glycosyltransferase family 2 protein [uncultured Maribacter sp.]|uniref:glycosyltransferase family 2 protein n=1 Tax=uncultured Maribacter sp. TaxID=431308 RepID=UPI0026247EB5|nr:glycosyltransferase family 2 protein [uncultured Maribacter sp.]
MKNIAVLLTCYNRKEKTIQSLEYLFKASELIESNIKLSVYLTDDGSTDGTSEYVLKKFPNVTILKGSGSLFWAGGMRNSWKEAIKNNYDAYLLLNDDTNVFPNVFKELILTHEKCIEKYGSPGIYIGSTKDEESKKLSYGGAVLTNNFLFKYHFIEPNGDIQSCDLGNANIMLVSKYTVDKIGTLSEGYLHGVADYDYTLKAVNKKIPVLITPSFCGTCTDDHSDIYDDYHSKPLLERYKILKNPLGLDFKSNLTLMKRHFPFRVPFVVISAILKVLLPKIYVKGLAKR